MDTMGEVLRKYPEFGVFFVVGVGYWIGSFKVRGFGLGAVTGSLIAGLLVGQWFAVPVSSTAKSVLFLLFLFAIGYSVGPKFFQAMKGDGLRWALLSLAMSVTGLAATYAVARVLGLDVGFAAGLLSGALTESPAIGTAMEAINALPLPEAQRDRLVAHVAVADAVCYVYGALGVIIFCSVIAPRLLGIDLVAEARRVEDALGIDRARPGVVSAWRQFELRGYRILPGGGGDGRSVTQIEVAVPGARLFVERVRRDDAMLQVTPDLRMQAGDLIAVSGQRKVLAEAIGRAGVEEVDDHDLLDLPVVSFDVFVSSRDAAGKTVAELVASDLPIRGVFLRDIRRRGHAIPVAPGTVIERGDVLRLSGAEMAVKRAAAALGQVVAPTDTTDFVALCLAIVIGGIAGVFLVVPVAGLRIAVGTSVGTLLAGLVVGHLHAMRPTFARIPEGAVAFMIAFGLAAFVGMIGLSAGPHFMRALREAGLGLFLGGMVVTTLPLVVGLYVGRYVLKLDPVLLLGGLAGAQTMTAALAAVQERSQSSVAVIGYSGTVAFGHILLTTWGTVIVNLLA